MLNNFEMMMEGIKKNMGMWFCFIPYVTVFIIQTIMIFLFGNSFIKIFGEEDGMASIILFLLIKIVGLLVFGYWYYRLISSYKRANAVNINTLNSNSIENATSNKKIWDSRENKNNINVCKGGLRCIEFLTFRNVIVLIFLGIYTQIAGAYLLTFILPLFPNLYESYMGTIDSLTENNIFIWISVGLISPVAEELIFRGVIYKYARRYAPYLITNLLQAALFGIYHGNIVQGIYAFLLGLLMGFLVNISGSIIPSIIFHLSVNIFGLFIDKIIPETLPEAVQVSLMLVSIGIVVFIIRLFIRWEHEVSNKYA